MTSSMSVYEVMLFDETGLIETVEIIAPGQKEAEHDATCHIYEEYGTRPISLDVRVKRCDP